MKWQLSLKYQNALSSLLLHLHNQHSGSLMTVLVGRVFSSPTTYALFPHCLSLLGSPLIPFSRFSLTVSGDGAAHGANAECEIEIHLVRRGREFCLWAGCYFKCSAKGIISFYRNT